MELYNESCFDVLDDLIASGVKVNCVITDPPYGMSFKSNFRKEKHNKIENDDDLDWLENWVYQLNQVTAENSHLYVFCSWHKIDIFKQSFEKWFNIKNILVWEKNNTGMGDLFGDYAPMHEFVLFMHKGRRNLNGTRDPNIIKNRRTTNEFHPTQKPVDLMKYFIEKSTDKGESVLDCFMGSGTTGIAARILDRKFIGIEIDKEYFKIAKQRIENEGNQTSLF